MVARYQREDCPHCHRSIEGIGDQTAALARHMFESHPDSFMLDAMREVDELAPAAPPISVHLPPAPPPLPAPDLDLFDTVWK